MTYDPRKCGARCDECPLGPKGRFRDGYWQPVPPERHTGATILAVAEMPHTEDAGNGRPLSGRSGQEWNAALLALGKRRTDIDLTHVVACSAGTQPNAWEKMQKALDKENRRLLAQGLPVLPDPITCCRPRLLTETDSYENILSLGRVAANSLTGKAQSIFALRGGPVWVDENYGALLETPLAGDAVPDGAVRKVFPMFHPGFVQKSPGWRHVLHADLGKALRWFSGALRWTEPVRTFNPSPDALEAFLARPAPFWAYDLETDGIESLVCKVRSIAIAHPDLNAEGRALRPGQEEATRCEVMGLNILSGDGSTRYYEPADEARILDILRAFFQDTTKTKVGHNAGYYDRQVVEQWIGVTPLPIIDTLFAARFRAPELPKGLKVVGSVLTDVDRWETTEKGESLAFGQVDDWDRLAYNCTDSSVNARIVVPLFDAAEEAGAFRDLPEALRPVGWENRRWDLHELDHATQDMCVNLHKIGVYIDQESRFKMEIETRASVTKREKNLSELARAVGVGKLDLKSAGANDDGDEVAGVKPGSADQIRDLLYENWKLGIPPNMEARDFYTMSGMPGPGDKVLRGHLAGGRLTKEQEAFIRELRLYRREKNKILGTVLLPLNLTAHDPKKGVVWHPDGRVRSTWNAHVTAPGRLSSSGPNLQNIGSRKGQGKLKTLFAAEPGHLLVGADLDQAHLRIAANYWKIPLLLECFSEGEGPAQHARVSGVRRQVQERGRLGTRRVQPLQEARRRHGEGDARRHEDVPLRQYLLGRSDDRVASAHVNRVGRRRDAVPPHGVEGGAALPRDVAQERAGVDGCVGRDARDVPAPGLHGGTRAGATLRGPLRRQEERGRQLPHPRRRGVVDASRGAGAACGVPVGSRKADGPHPPVPRLRRRGDRSSAGPRGLEAEEGRSPAARAGAPSKARRGVHDCPRSRLGSATHRGGQRRKKPQGGLTLR